MKVIGKLEKVDLRELWSSETTDFIPWLSEEENIAELGNILKMELEVQKQEQKAGTRQAGILCKDLHTGNPVIIGTQLDRSDHTHLGQLMTGSAGMEEITVIWIAGSFSDEHREVLGWLNKITGSSVRFFGIEMEAYRIGESLPAPNFNIVAQPDDWTGQVITPATAQKLTDIELLELEYWHGLKNFMETNKSTVNLLGTPPKSWFKTTRDKGKYFLSVAVNSRDISLNILLNIIGEQAREDFDRLYEIAYLDSLVEVNQDLRWNKIQSKLGCAVTLKAYADFMEKNDWPNQFAWFKENLERFDKYFRPRLNQL